MGRSACTLGEDSAAAAALDGLLAAGDGDSPGGGGSSSTADGIVRTIAIAFLQSRGCLWQCFPFGTYSTVDGGVPKRSKNDHFTTSISMDDNGLIIRSK